MFIPGLVSISFRQLNVPQIIQLCADHGLTAIEWGGDVHVPHGDVAIAEATRKATVAAGLSVAAYGSYYRCNPTAEQPIFDDVLASARALQAPIIRVWAGTLGSAETSPTRREAIAEDLKRIGDQAAAAGLRIALEYHQNTLTDDPDSALSLIGQVNHPNVGLYWQTSNGRSADYSHGVLQRLLPHISHLHVFHWNFAEDGSFDRRPLAEAFDTWVRFLRSAKPAPGQSRHLLLEFVRNDSTAQLASDAETLNNLISAVR